MRGLTAIERDVLSRAVARTNGIPVPSRPNPRLDVVSELELRGLVVPVVFDADPLCPGARTPTVRAPFVTTAGLLALRLDAMARATTGVT